MADSDSTQTAPVAASSLAIYLLLLVLAVVFSCFRYWGIYLAGYGLFSGSTGAFLSIFAIPGSLLLILVLTLKNLSFKDSHTALRIVAGFAAGILVVALMFTPLRPGATIYLDGFIASNSKSDLEKLEAWGRQLLQKYSDKSLKLAPQPWKTLHGAPEISADEIPPEIQTLWEDRPTSYAIEDFDNDGQTCVLVSWYLCGILVGKPDYKTTFRAFDVREVRPGVYFFIREK